MKTYRVSFKIYNEEHVKSLDEAAKNILNNLDWTDTQEGAVYWEQVHDKLIRIKDELSRRLKETERTKL